MADLQVAARPALTRQVVKPQAFFGFGSKPSADKAAAAPQYYICKYALLVTLLFSGAYMQIRSCLLV